MAKLGRATSKPGIQRRSRVRAVLGRVFARRNIIIISDHKTQHVPVHPLLQLVVFASALGFVTWASYTTGSYVTAQNVLKEKERKLASTKEENERIGAEFALLRRDLVKVLKKGGNGKNLDEYAQMVAQQYTDNGAPATATTQATADGDKEQEAAQNAILARIEYLENKVNDLQSTHDEMIADIRATTGGKIKEIESIIAGTGLDSTPLEKAAALKVKQEAEMREKYGRSTNAAAKANGNSSSDEDPNAAAQGDGQGGPFIPADTGVLKEKETDLYFNLKRMMVLHEVVAAMPLGRPITDARLSSGYGTRIDPFNGRLARHTGQDFAGPYGEEVKATADGIVADAGDESGYGNAVDVEHGFGISTKYAHLSKIMVQPGQHVKKGQTVGLEGSTGRSTGPHLHYEVRYNNTPINPKGFFDNPAYDGNDG